MFLPLTLIFSAAVLGLSQGQLQPPVELCMELNARISNERVAEEVARTGGAAVANARVPQQDVGLPIMEPFREPVAGSYRVKGGEIELRNLRYEGIGNTQFFPPRITGEGSIRIMNLDAVSPRDTFTADYSVPGTDLSGKIYGVLTERLTLKSSAIAPGSVTHQNLETTAKSIQVILEPELNISLQDRQAIATQLTNNLLSFITGTFFSNVIRHRC